jgi:hypothetical protein
LAPVIEKDVLFTLAELGVALAGFSAIVGVLSTRKEATSRRINALRLQVMLETCFMVVAAALLPVLLDKFGIQGGVLWQAASAGFLCVAIPFEFIARRRTKELPTMTLTRINVNTVNWALSLGADLVLAAILLNLVGALQEAFYLVALCFQLAVAGILFVQFAAEVFADPG